MAVQKTLQTKLTRNRISISYYMWIGKAIQSLSTREEESSKFYLLPPVRFIIWLASIPDIATYCKEKGKNKTHLEVLSYFSGISKFTIKKHLDALTANKLLSCNKNKEEREEYSISFDTFNISQKEDRFTLFEDKHYIWIGNAYYEYELSKNNIREGRSLTLNYSLIAWMIERTQNNQGIPSIYRTLAEDSGSSYSTVAFSIPSLLKIGAILIDKHKKEITLRSFFLPKEKRRKEAVSKVKIFNIEAKYKEEPVNLIISAKSTIEVINLLGTSKFKMSKRSKSETRDFKIRMAEAAPLTLFISYNNKDFDVFDGKLSDISL